jgi:hypothetical protein
MSFTIAAGPRQRSYSRVRVPRDSRLYFSLRFETPHNLEGQVPVFISPRNRVAQLYPQALSSLLVASYNSQSYGGGIRTRLSLSFSLMLRPTVSRPACLGIKHPFGTYDQIFIIV